ncbi:secreted salivary gland peptide-like [Tropilaelaps mercedesae]|uniref:Secreted salivary gland peptide-like n=1 Tax=Tropilaelaps mercedesae TaxID=418985 RepID=A0A1V9Y3W5_9ACAR|nr:secreted salivary gland peptide-like [Tropilaelaps mercedesae]
MRLAFLFLTFVPLSRILGENSISKAAARGDAADRIIIKDNHFRRVRRVRRWRSLPGPPGPLGDPGGWRFPPTDSTPFAELDPRQFYQGSDSEPDFSGSRQLGPRHRHKRHRWRPQSPPPPGSDELGLLPDFAGSRRRGRPHLELGSLASSRLRRRLSLRHRKRHPLGPEGSGYGQPGGSPDLGRPSYEQPVGSPGPGGPNYEQPFGPPGLGGPRYDQPFGPPVPGSPSYEQPIRPPGPGGPRYDQPFGPPGPGGPSYEQPVKPPNSGEPSYEQPVKSSGPGGPSYEQSVRPPGPGGPSYEQLARPPDPGIPNYEQPGGSSNYPTGPGEAHSQHNYASDGNQPVLSFQPSSQGQPPSTARPVLRFQSSCGVSTTSRIVGGEEVQKDDWSWTVALMRPAPEGLEQFCGATLISDQHLLTAAHCIAKMKGTAVTARAGHINLNKANPAQDLQLEKAILHPLYNSSSYYADIAIVKLKKPIQFSTRIQPCCLPEATDKAGQNAVAVGWGSTSFGGPTTSVLQQVTLPIWSNQECQNKINIAVHDVMLCAGLKDSGGHDACQGDSGGPLLVRNSDQRWSLEGIISFGFKCAQKGVPGVYTRVSKFTDWIVNTAV